MTSPAITPEDARRTIRGTALHGARVAELEAELRGIPADDDETLKAFLAAVKAEADADLEARFGGILAEAAKAFRTDTGYAIDIAKAGGPLAARRREKAEASTRPATYTCPPDHTHAATGTCYRMHSCRCEDCRVAVAARRKSRAKSASSGSEGPSEATEAVSAPPVSPAPERRHRRPLSEDDERHGTWNAYGYYKCRCEKCRAAATEYQRARNEK